MLDLTFSVYLDDLTVFGEAPIGQQPQLVLAMADGVGQATDVVERTLGCTLAPAKTAVVATTETAATALAKVLGLQAGHPICPLDSGVLLGCEVRMGGIWRRGRAGGRTERQTEPPHQVSLAKLYPPPPGGFSQQIQPYPVSLT